MRHAAFVILLPALLLAGCNRTVIEEEERDLPVAPAFSGERVTTIDYGQSFIAFVGKSNIIDHEGKFEEFTVEFTPAAADPADLTRASINVTIDLASVQSDPGVTDHMRREDFFDVENHPVATFTSSSIRSLGGDAYEIEGELTLKGVTHEAVFSAEITDAYITAHYDLPRREFGVGNDSYGNKFLDPLVPVEVKLMFEE